MFCFTALDDPNRSCAQITADLWEPRTDREPAALGRDAPGAHGSLVHSGVADTSAHRLATFKGNTNCQAIRRSLTLVARPNLATGQTSSPAEHFAIACLTSRSDPSYL